MALRVLPSAVVEFIDFAFPFAKDANQAASSRSHAPLKVCSSAGFRNSRTRDPVVYDAVVDLLRTLRNVRLAREHGRILHRRERLDRRSALSLSSEGKP